MPIAAPTIMMAPVTVSNRPGVTTAQQRGVRADPGEQVAGTPLVVLRNHLDDCARC